MNNKLKFDLFKRKFIYFLIILYLIRRTLFQEKLFEFKYSKFFELYNGNYLLCTEDGIYIYDYEFKKNLSDYKFTTKIQSREDFEFVSFAQYSIEDGGKIIVLYKEKIYFLEQSGSIIIESPFNVTQTGSYYTLVPYKDGREYYFIVGYLNYKIYIGYYKFDIQTKSIFMINMLGPNIPNNYNCEQESSLNGFSCNIMCSKKFGKVLTCFYERVNFFGVTSFYIGNFSIIEELPTLNDKTVFPLMIHSDISEDKSKALICHLESSSKDGYCSYYDINEHKLSNLTKYSDNCSRFPSTLNIFYSKRSKEYICSCYSYLSTFTIVKFDENFNIIKSDNNIQLSGCSFEFVSIIYSYQNNNYSLISSCGEYNAIKLYTLQDIFNPLEKPFWSYIISESNIINNKQNLKTTFIKNTNIKNYLSNYIYTNIKTDIFAKSNKKYYYDEEKNEKIILEEGQPCPVDFLYENKNTKECLKTCNYIELLNNRCYINNVTKENFDIITKEIRNIINNTYITSDTNIVIEGSNSLYQIISSLNMNDNKNKNISIIDFGECEIILKREYHIDYLLVFKIDTKMNNSSATILNYEVYNPITLEMLDLSLCQDTKINTYTNYNPSQESLNKIIKLNESGYDLYNINDSFYQDLCSPFTSENGTDILLSDRIADYYENISLCEDGCTYKNYNYETKKVQCECQIKKEIEITINEVDKDNFFSSFINSDTFSNIKVLKCFKLVFSLNGQSNNIGSYIFILIIFVLFTLSIIFRIYQIKNIIRIIRKIINDDENYNDNLNKNNNITNIIDISNNANNNNENSKEIINNENNNINRINKVNNNINKYKNNINNNIILKDNINPSSPTIKTKRKKKKRNTVAIFNRFNIKKQEIINNNIKSGIVHNDKTNEKNQSNNSSIFNRISYNKNAKDLSTSNSLRKNLMFNFQDIISEYNQNINKKKDFKKNYHYNDEELNSLDYNNAIQYDKRTYYQYYCSLLKKKHLLFFTFFNNNDYNIFTLKLALFIFSFSLYFTVNVLFFDDNNVHHLYEKQGDIDYLSQIPYIFYSTIISSIINIIIKVFALSNKDMLRIKKIKNFDEAIKESALLIDKLKLKFNLFFVICFLFINFFWYFISAFCAVYKNSQALLIDNTISSFILSLIYPLGFNLIPGLIRIPSVKYKFRFSNIFYIISKIIAYI